MKRTLRSKILGRVLITIITFNMILTIMIAYEIFKSYHKSIEFNMKNIQVSTQVMLKRINGNDDELIKVVREIKSLYNVEVILFNSSGNKIFSTDGNREINTNNYKFAKDTMVLEIRTDISTLNGIITFPLIVNNDNLGNMVLIKRYIDEYRSIMNLISSIIIVQIVLVFIVSYIISKFVNKQIQPIKDLQNSMNSYEKGINIENLNIRTGDEIEELSDNFFSMIKVLELQKEKNTDFFNNVTHELKTPITAISGYAQILNSKCIEEIKPEFQKRALSRIDLESKKMLIEIEKLLDVSRGQLNGGNNIEEINGVDIVNEVLDIVKEIYIEKEFNISINKELKIKCNKEEVKTIVSNIIGNAGKYSKDKVVNIYLDKGRMIVKNKIYIIPEEMADNLLEPFVKFNPINKEVDSNSISSTGLGLYLSKMLADKNGLKLKYEIEGEYIRFILEN